MMAVYDWDRKGSSQMVETNFLLVLLLYLLRSSNTKTWTPLDRETTSKIFPKMDGRKVVKNKFGCFYLLDSMICNSIAPEYLYLKIQLVCVWLWKTWTRRIPFIFGQRVVVFVLPVCASTLHVRTQFCILYPANTYPMLHIIISFVT
jgi:hypothetical protein